MLAVFGWDSINYVVIPLSLICVLAAGALYLMPKHASKA
jgi:hypothetical protein